jgi:ATP-dependent Lhr-like helicase
MLSAVFHPLTQQWFAQRFAAPTEPQARAWPEIQAGRHTLVAAPTGSGKTLAAFLVCLDRLLRRSLEGTLADGVQVVYVSPLKALSNDIHRNLELPLAELRAAAESSGHVLPPWRVALRTGDTLPSERQAMLRRPPHLLVTTPESLYLLLTSPRAAALLHNVETVIVDEIHALARDKRGSHLALSLERLAALTQRPPARIGLSATQRPIEEIARFLVGTANVDEHGQPLCSIIDLGHARELDLAIEVPPDELNAVCSHELWGQIYARLAELIQQRRSTLVFVNTRRLAERVAHQLGQLLGENAVASHHGSLSRELRLAAEERLQRGELKAIVATASLELGIDVGYIDLVCQVGSPRSMATFLQRVGRSGHYLGGLPRGRLFPLTRDELLECLALVRAVKQGRLDAVEMPEAPLDILAQQIVAAVSAAEQDEESLYALCRRAWPYRALPREDFDHVVELLSEGYVPGRRRLAWLHRDRVHGRLRARRGARLAALANGGAIPDLADYRVVTAEERTFVGTVNEDFAIESMAGDVFLLGTTSWRVVQVRLGEMVVEDAQAAPATIPFWLGEAPGRTVELSAELSRLRAELAERAADLEFDNPPQRGDGKAASAAAERPLLAELSLAGAARAEANGQLRSVRSAAVEWLCNECGASRWAAQQAVFYVAAQQAALGLVPTQQQVVFERFFDEAGGMQLVIHAPFGSRINRAWGLAMRKRFCRSFDFELQASANDNGIVLSLGPQHSFPLEHMFKMLNPQNAYNMLTQALLAAPMFRTRWRWNVTRALAMLRQEGGRRVPPTLQRFRAEDLLSAIFPAQTACLENVVGDIPIPDHPLVRQTVHDCLHEAMDWPRWLELLKRIEAGEVQLVARDTREPSPFSYEILNANPYAFLDGAPLEERRARAVATRRTLELDTLADLTRLDPEAIAQVCAEAQPTVRDADELHDLLLSLLALPAEEGEPWQGWFEELLRSGRAARLLLPDGAMWAAAERLAAAQGLWPHAAVQPALSLPPERAGSVEAVDARKQAVRGHIEISGPVTAQALAARLRQPESAVAAALEALEAEGVVLRGRFLPDLDALQWCDRRLLARIHRLTLAGARRRVQPVSPAVFWQFLCSYHQLEAGAPSGRAALKQALERLQGFEAAAGAWERDLLPARVADYQAEWLDELCLNGFAGWARLSPPRRAEDDPPPARLNRTAPLALYKRQDLNWLLPPGRRTDPPTLRPHAQAVLEALAAHGALFPADLPAATDLLPAYVEEALAELAAVGLAAADAFSAIRQMVGLDMQRTRRGRQRPLAHGGRWSRFPPPLRWPDASLRCERWAWLLLARYGVVCRDLLVRESLAPPWYELRQVYRRLEAQGRVHGGRFVAQLAGEQYAALDVVDRLRQLRDAPATGRYTVISAADPLNLAGILTPGPRVPAKPRSTLLLCDGELAAVHEAGQTRLLRPIEPSRAEELFRLLRVTATVRRRWHNTACTSGRS